MSDAAERHVSKWILYFFDLVFVGLAAGILYVHRGTGPMTPWELVAIAVCVIAGAWLSITPYLTEHNAAVKLAESGNLASSLAQIQNLAQIAEQISIATAQWQIAQEQSAKAVEAANEISARMTTEAWSFAEFMQKSNDSEKATLRLEVDKLRRSEGEWLQIVTRMLDHVYALHQAGLRSRQPGLIQQLGNFQNACRDTVRRIGLLPFTVEPNSPFDPEMHQPADEALQPIPGTPVAEALATGYTYQGQLLRRAVVILAAEAAAPAIEPEPNQPGLFQS